MTILTAFLLAFAMISIVVAVVGLLGLCRAFYLLVRRQLRRRASAGASGRAVPARQESASS